MNDFTSQQGVNPPEDTTDYSDDDVLIRREREREQLFEQQRQMNDVIAASNRMQVEGPPYQQEPEEGFYAIKDEYSDTLKSNPGPDPEFLAQRDLEVRTIALNSVVQAGAFNSFDEMMDNTKQVYKWLIEGAQGEAAGGPETA